jgi:hypothetical protein
MRKRAQTCSIITIIIIKGAAAAKDVPEESDEQRKRDRFK